MFKKRLRNLKSAAVVALAAALMASPSIASNSGVADEKGPTIFSQTRGLEAVVTGEAIFSRQNIDYLIKKGVVLAEPTGTNKLVLHKGNVLLACTNDVDVSLTDCDVHVDAGSIVYCRECGNGYIVVLNFHDSHKDAVTVWVGNEHFHLPPGRELVLTRQLNATFDEANSCPGIWYRSLIELHPTPQLKGFVTQFSTLSSFRVLPAVRRMAASHSKAGRDIVKTAAAVYMISKDPRDFRYKLSDIELQSAKPAQTHAIPIGTAEAKGPGS